MKRKIQKYEVCVYDNFHFGDDDDYDVVGRFDEYSSAEYAAMDIVRKSLEELYKQGDTPESIYERYLDFGDSPSIRCKVEGGPNKFLPSVYAKEWAPLTVKRMGNPMPK